MGLDISLVTDNNDELYAERENILELDYTHTLSRSFCNMTLRKDAIEGESELDQLGRIAGVNIDSLHEMMCYPQEANLLYVLSRIQTEEEKQDLIQKAEVARAKVADNLDRVMVMVENLINSLAQVPDLAALIDSKQYSDPYTACYFSNFAVDTGDGYIGNNLGQDLRNFRNFLLYAQDRGSRTVWVEYG